MKQQSIKIIQDKKKLQDIYDDLGFRLVGIKQEAYRKTAFYQKRIT